MNEETKILEAEQQASNQRKNLTSAELLNIFIAEMNASATFKFIDEAKNPCHIMFEGVEYYVYVKNLSSAYFSNPDVSRAQLTGVDTLLQIKKSDALFILLGYDADNHVFAAWNPHVAKQRIGTASSPSLYSRFSWQKEAVEQRNFITRELKNDGSVLLFPQEYISLFLGNIEMFFPDTSEYVAMGSKRRSEANAAYRELTNIQHLSKFGQYMNASGFDPQTIKENVRAIKHLINTSLISNNRKIFLACDTLEEYHDAANEFLALDEIKLMDAEMNNAFSYALPVYIDYLIDEYGVNMGETDEYTFEPPELTEEELQLIPEAEDSAEVDEVDYESPFTDDNGILTCIANPILIDLLREDLDSEYPRPLSAYATVEDFYGDLFPNMEMYHWQALFKKIDWSNTYILLENYSESYRRKRSVRQKIRVVLNDGRLICEKQVVNTLIEVIKYAGVEKVRSLNITMGKNGGAPLVDTVINPKYSSAFKELGGGLYANTFSDTATKYGQIQKINDLLNLGMQVFLE
mgnify:FL=1